jgi:hypothetical protein
VPGHHSVWRSGSAASVQKTPWPMSDMETTLEVDRMVAGKELVIRCMDTGAYTRAVLTEGQGGTFVEMEAGKRPRVTARRRRFRRPSERSARAARRVRSMRPFLPLSPREWTRTC